MPHDRRIPHSVPGPGGRQITAALGAPGIDAGQTAITPPALSAQTRVSQAADATGSDPLATIKRLIEEAVRQRSAQTTAAQPSFLKTLGQDVTRGAVSRLLFGAGGQELGQAATARTTGGQVQATRQRLAQEQQSRSFLDQLRQAQAEEQKLNNQRLEILQRLVSGTASDEEKKRIKELLDQGIDPFRGRTQSQVGSIFDLLRPPGTGSAGGSGGQDIVSVIEIATEGDLEEIGRLVAQQSAQ